MASVTRHTVHTACAVICRAREFARITLALRRHLAQIVVRDMVPVTLLIADLRVGQRASCRGLRAKLRVSRQNQGRLDEG